MADLYIVGIGPGAYKSMTMEAADALSKCPVIVGYTVYADLIREHFPDKEYITTAMRQEEVRCRMALDRAAEGIDTAVVCSGGFHVDEITGQQIKEVQQAVDEICRLLCEALQKEEI